MVSYIILSIYFLSKTMMSVLGIFKYNIYKREAPLTFEELKISRKGFYGGLIEHLTLLILVNLLYFLK